MSTILKTVAALDEKLKNLIERYVFLKEENEILLENMSELQHKNTLLKEKLEQSQEQYRLLKVAKTIEGSKEDNKETKQKINSLIREIDKCIIRLNQ